MQNRPCPVCSAPDGFHDEAPHSAAREAIPAALRRPSNSALRRERYVDAIQPDDTGETVVDALNAFLAYPLLAA